MTRPLTALRRSHSVPQAAGHRDRSPVREVRRQVSHLCVGAVYGASLTVARRQLRPASSDRCVSRGDAARTDASAARVCDECTFGLQCVGRALGPHADGRAEGRSASSAAPMASRMRTTCVGLSFGPLLMIQCAECVRLEKDRDGCPKIVVRQGSVRPPLTP